MGNLRRLNDFLCYVLTKCCMIFVLIFTGVVIFQVLARNYILVSVPWTDEVALILFVWSVFLGAAVALRKRMHYLVDLFPPSCKRTNSFLDLFASFLVLGVVLVLLYGGSVFANMGLSRRFSSILITQSWLFVSMPIAAVCMLLFSVENIANDFSKLKNALRKGDA